MYIEKYLLSFRTLPLPFVSIIFSLVTVNAAWAKFTHVATHPEASKNFYATQQPPGPYRLSHRGREIKVLRAFKNRLYMGYGQDDGPNKPGTCSAFYVNSSSGAPWCALTLRYYDPSTGKIYAPQGTIRSQELSTLEVMGGSLYGLAADREGEADYIKCSASGCVDGIIDKGSTAHLYSATEMNGTIFMAGSSGRDGVVWKSSNGGRDWAEALRSKPASKDDFSRFYQIGGPLYGLVYAHARDLYNGFQSASQTYNGNANNAWKSSTLSLETWGPAFRLRGFAGIAIYIEGVELKQFDGKTSRLDSVAHALDFTINGEWLYALANRSRDHKVFRTKDLKTWQYFDTAPSTAISIEVVSGAVYVGTSDAKVYKSDRSLDDNVVMEPVYYLLFDE